LEGILTESDVLSATIDVGGIGYSVSVPLTVSCKLPPVGNRMKLQIYASYGENQQNLYGFLTRAERDFFKLIVEKVSGVGPRTALNIMSKLSLSALVGAVESGDAEILAKCHGIGKKSAERIIMELSDRDIAAIAAKTEKTNQPNAATSGIANDAIAALLSLGYKSADAEKAVRKSIELLGDGAPAETIIRSALNS
jgi:Holliday junction DNA helicase RuvA